MSFMRFRDKLSVRISGITMLSDLEFDDPELILIKILFLYEKEIEDGGSK